MYRLMVAAAMTAGIVNPVASQVMPAAPGAGDFPMSPCTSTADSPPDTKPVEARWDYVCPRERYCSVQFSRNPALGGVLEASVFVLKAGLLNRAFSAAVRTREGTTYYYTENPQEFSWSVQNMTLQCKP
jgi:hypothetical protein